MVSSIHCTAVMPGRYGTLLVFATCRTVEMSGTCHKEVMSGTVSERAVDQPPILGPIAMFHCRLKKCFTGNFTGDDNSDDVDPHGVVVCVVPSVSTCGMRSRE